MAKPTLKECLTDIPLAAVLMGWPFILGFTILFGVAGMVLWIAVGDNPMQWFKWSCGTGAIFGFLFACFTVSNYNVQ